MTRSERLFATPTHRAVAFAVGTGEGVVDRRGGGVPKAVDVHPAVAGVPRSGRKHLAQRDRVAGSSVMSEILAAQAKCPKTPEISPSLQRIGMVDRTRSKHVSMIIVVRPSEILASHTGGIVRQGAILSFGRTGIRPIERVAVPVFVTSSLGHLRRRERVFVDVLACRSCCSNRCSSVKLHAS